MHWRVECTKRSRRLAAGPLFVPWYAIKFTSGIRSTVQCGRHADFEYGVSSLSHD
ncbi:hypothetical protein BIFBRE_04640 [Bifidobacterium breve DSM 20213 = JCM 1192]|uniref:Uncharacterized protein n=1 Tax=Bifidobacterium breve DSM 20213 = JCM 1192 TaxID=518634 RepID=D4BRA4_BIFBR|nr:hypothetical protein BIFBRE_04640 [Bifidobacterium breve DSM 20213 = JCM 1192]